MSDASTADPGSVPALTVSEFLDWLRSYGLDPRNVAAVEFVPTGAQGGHVHMRVETWATIDGRRFPDRHNDAAKEVRWVPLIGLPGSSGPGFTPQPTISVPDATPTALDIEIEANGTVVETTVLDTDLLGELVATVARTTGLETIHPDTLTLVLRDAAGRELAQDTTAATARIVNGARLTLSAPDVPAVD